MLKGMGARVVKVVREKRGGGKNWDLGPEMLSKTSRKCWKRLMINTKRVQIHPQRHLNLVREAKNNPKRTWSNGMMSLWTP